MPSMTFFSAQIGETDLFTTEDYYELELKIEAFKKIYRALREAQDNHDQVKTNFLEGKEKLAAHELAALIQQHYESDKYKDETDQKKEKKKRTTKAWRLAVDHYQNCSSINSKLFNEIYHFACNNVHYCGLTVSYSFYKPKTFTQEQINNGEHHKDKIGFKIVRELDWNARNFTDYSMALDVR